MLALASGDRSVYLTSCRNVHHDGRVEDDWGEEDHEDVVEEHEKQEKACDTERGDAHRTHEEEAYRRS